ncbi:MAG TPA: hypothetical protein VHF26_09740 [Trebonia sp.]|nr:hypothetical protein [Trebonia sp.]
MRRITFDKLLGWAGTSLGALLLVVASLLLWASAYIHNNVYNQLAAQQITFPSAAAFQHPTANGEITQSMIPSVSQYAGQPLVTGQQAEAYADHFIAVHLQEMGGGKTYSQLSAESQAQPNNAQLASTVNTVFKGTTLRSMLLTAYSWWKVSQITYIVSLVAYGLGTVVFLGGLAGFGRILRDRRHPAARLGAHALAIGQFDEAGREAGTAA